MHKPLLILENEIRKVMWDFEAHINHPTLDRIPDLVITKKRKIKRTWCLIDFAVFVDHSVNIKEN